MNRYLWAGGVLLALACFDRLPAAAAEETTPPADAATFEMKEISIFDTPQDAGMGGMFGFDGLTVQTTNTPAKDVKAYPKLNSPHPLYGTIVLGQGPARAKQGAKYYFVLDQSPEALKAAQPDDKNKKEEKKASDKPDQGKKTKKSRPAAPAGQYDLLYIDGDHDLDLTNNPAVGPMKNAPKMSGPFGGNAEVFDPVTVSLAEGQKTRLVPVVASYGGPRIVQFRLASIRQGEIKLGQKTFKATLSPPHGQIGGFDGTSARLVLRATEGPQRSAMSYWMDSLGTIREADGEFYMLSASPSGDKVYVRVAPGDRGVLEVSAGKRDIKELGLAGLLQLDGKVLPLGDMSSFLPNKRTGAAKYRLPVGKYQPMLLYVTYGHLQVGLRQNYGRAGGNAAGVIEIRKDKPYVLDFSEKAEMQFLAPPKDKTFKPGDTIRFSAMLAIPEKNLQLSGLNDTAAKEGEMKVMDESGKIQTMPRFAALEPVVEITDAAGKKLGGGKMPFG